MNQSAPAWKLLLVFVVAIGLTVIVLKGGNDVDPKKEPVAPEIEAAQQEAATPVSPKKSIETEDIYAPATLISEGRFAIFGTHHLELEISLSGKFDRMPIGKGKCAYCHLFVEGHKQDRCPDLRGIEKRSHERIKENRYKMFTEKFATTPESVSGLKSKATSGGEYILESIYCPNCYVVEGFGIEGSDDLLSEMPVMSHMPYKMTDYEMISVASYLQSMDTPEDFSKITAPEDWRNYFNKKLPPRLESPKVFASVETLAETEKLTDSVEEIIEKGHCFVCHKIPGIPFARIGVIAPVLTMKTTAALRLASPEYQQAVAEGPAKATTPREYVMESILHPAAFILPGFEDDDGMPGNYRQKLTIGDLQKLVNFLLTIDKETAEKDGLTNRMGIGDPVERGHSKLD